MTCLIKNSRHPEKSSESKLIHKAKEEDDVMVNKENNVNERVWEYLISSRVFYACTINMEGKVQHKSIEHTQILTVIQISVGKIFYVDLFIIMDFIRSKRYLLEHPTSMNIREFKGPPH